MRIVSCIVFIVANLWAAGASASGAQDCATVVEVLKVEDGTPKQTFAARVLLSKKTSGHSADCNSLLGEQTVTLDAPVDGLATGQRLSLNAHVWSDAMAGGGTTWTTLPAGEAAALVDAAAKSTVQCKVSIRASNLTVANGKTNIKGEVKAADPPCEWLVGTTHEIVPEGTIDPEKPVELYLNTRYQTGAGLELAWFVTPQEIEPPPPEVAPEPEPEQVVEAEAKPSSGCSVAGGELGLLALLGLLPFARRRRQTPSRLRM